MDGANKPIGIGNRNRDELGLTLIELLVALVISSMMLVTLVYVLRAEQMNYQSNLQRSQVTTSVSLTYDALRVFLLQAEGEPLHITSTEVSWQDGASTFSAQLQQSNGTSYFLLTYGDGHTVNLDGANTSFQGSTFQSDSSIPNLIDFHVVATSTAKSSSPYTFAGDTSFSTQSVQ